MQGTRMAAFPAVLPVDTNGLYTADEFMALPLDLKRYDLVRGMLVEVPVTGFKHGVIEVNIVLLLGQHVRQRRLGQLTPGDAKHLLEHDPDTLRQPDVAFVRSERLPPPEEWEAYGRVVPDLAVEILSPSNTAAEMREKVAEYLRVGVLLVWIVDPERETVTIHTSDAAPVILPAAADITGGAVLPDFRCPVAAFFDLA